MSLRAVGEGHISTTVFQTGTIGAAGLLRLDPALGRSARPHIVPEAQYSRDLLRRKLCEMGIASDMADIIFERLPERFTHAELDAVTTTVRSHWGEDPRLSNIIAVLEWLVRSNYRLKLEDDDNIADLVLFPRSETESKGIEDMRLVRFVDDDGAVTYFGTYTGFNGQGILPMLMETPDFRTISIHTLNGACVQNKGMALFPRRIDGHYAMCSRIDGHNLFLMFSDYIHFWESAQVLARPRYPWEWRLIGNCGSPQETPEGWLLITHGVGPMRRYSIGAMLLDARGSASNPRQAERAADHGRGAGPAGICSQCRLLVRFSHPRQSALPSLRRIRLLHEDRRCPPLRASRPAPGERSLSPAPPGVHRGYRSPHWRSFESRSSAAARTDAAAKRAVNMRLRRAAAEPWAGSALPKARVMKADAAGKNRRLAAVWKRSIPDARPAP